MRCRSLARRGEVLALLGENGAGKSTLIKVLAGAHIPDAGQLEILGEPVVFRSPTDAKKAGVAVIYQEFNLIPALTAAENIFLGQERTAGGFIRRGHERRAARQLFARIGVAIDPDISCRDLSVAQQQVIEIAKALSIDARIIVMDEPSAALTPQEVERLFVIVALRSPGNWRHLHQPPLGRDFSNRQSRHRHARRSGGWQPGHWPAHPRADDRNDGRPHDRAGIPQESRAAGRSAAGGAESVPRHEESRNVSFEVRRGEVLGLTGLVGAGRTETARLIFGADRTDAGSVTLDGKPTRMRGPRAAIRAGIALLSEDRKSQGLVLGHSVRENFALPNLRQLSLAGFVRRRREREAFGDYVRSLRIKIPNQEQAAKNLSGGNQQKVVLAKWLERNCEVVIFDEPTRGIDVGAKYEIYLLINELAAAGKAILMISSELPEVLGMSDRILVMHEGRITGQIDDVAQATQEQIMKLAIG